MTLRLPISLSLLLLALPAAYGQTADEFFHSGAQCYITNNIPQALQTVTNGRALYPDDIKLKKLEELLKQQQQQNQQDKNQQSKNDQQKQDKKDQQQENSDKPKEQKSEQQQARAAQAGQMTPQQAQRLLDTGKGDEQLLSFKPQGKPEDANKRVKDW